MKNIRAKQESLSNWREEFDIDEAKVDDKHSPEGKEKERNKRKYGNWPVSQGAQTSVRRGIHWSNRGDKKRKGAKVEEHVEGGINVQNVDDGLNFTEVETVDIIKPEPIKGASNWKLEMVTEMLISEGYNDEEIVTILSEELPKIPLGPIVTGAFKGAWNLSTGGVKNAYNAGKFVRSVFTRGGKDIKLTKDIFSTAKKLRQPKLPKGVDVVKKGAENKGGGLVKSFKGFMKSIKDRTTNKLNRTDIKTNTPTTTKKPVEVLGGAATNPATKIKPMKNITPAGERIKNVTDKVKIGAASGAGVVAGAAASKLNKGTFTKSKASGYVVDMDGYDPSDKQTPETTKKINDLTYKQMQRDKVDGPTQGKSDTIDGKKVSITHSSVYGKPTKRELRNKRNEYLSSPEGKRARRDASLQKKKDSGFPSRRMKSGTPVNQLFNKEEVTNEGLLSKIAKIGIGAFALKKGGEFLKKKGDEALDGARKNMKIGGDKRKSDIEKATGVKLDHYSWRDELGLIEGKTTTIRGIRVRGSGHPKDSASGTNDKPLVDYTKIRANAPVKTDTKVG